MEPLFMLAGVTAQHVNKTRIAESVVIGMIVALVCWIGWWRTCGDRWFSTIPSGWKADCGGSTLQKTGLCWCIRGHP